MTRTIEGTVSGGNTESREPGMGLIEFRVPRPDATARMGTRALIILDPATAEDVQQKIDEAGRQSPTGPASIVALHEAVQAIWSYLQTKRDEVDGICPACRQRKLFLSYQGPGIAARILCANWETCPNPYAANQLLN